MKGCPVCGRTYVDESISFCFDDGALLTTWIDPNARSSSQGTDEPQTIVSRNRATSSDLVNDGRRPVLTYVLIAGISLLIGAAIIWSLRPSPRESATVSAISNENASVKTPSGTPTPNRTATASPSPVGSPTSAPITVGGRWRNQFGQVSKISQSGESFDFVATGVACRGAFQSTGSGSIVGRYVKLSYTSNFSTGRCDGTISTDGQTIRSNCTDTACGPYAPISRRIGD